LPADTDVKRQWRKPMPAKKPSGNKACEGKIIVIGEAQFELPLTVKLRDGSTITIGKNPGKKK